jgi:Mor family transcriptional regulator
MARVLDSVERVVTRRVLEELRSGRAAPAEERAQDVATLSVADLRREWGGDRPYIALGEYTRARVRHARIRADFEAGAGVPELAERYGLARSTIYDIVRPLRRKR